MSNKSLNIDIVNTNGSAQEIELENNGAHLTDGGRVVPTSKGGGPRTKPGKQKSKQNATKYGIYSREVLIAGESRSEYDSLL